MLPELKAIKISAPAQRALEATGIKTFIKLCDYTEKELGPKAIRMLRELLEKEGLSFKKQK